jgi:hypothetical protein
MKAHHAYFFKIEALLIATALSSALILPKPGITEATRLIFL